MFILELFLTAEDRKRVEKLNLALGTRYRTTPYDFNNPGDFAEALILITAEYVDFSYYWGEVSNVSECLDESIETFYPAEWQRLALGEAARKDIISTVNSLRSADTALFKLAEKAEKQCREIWGLAMTCAPDEVLVEICGQAFRAEPEELAQLLTFDFEYSCQDIVDMWQYSVEETAGHFGRALEVELDAMRQLR